MRDAPYPEAVGALRAIPVIGPFSAAFILLRGLSRMNNVPLEMPPFLGAAPRIYGSPSIRRASARSMERSSDTRRTMYGCRCDSFMQTAAFVCTALPSRPLPRKEPARERRVPAPESSLARLLRGVMPAGRGDLDMADLGFYAVRNEPPAHSATPAVELGLEVRWRGPSLPKQPARPASASASLRVLRPTRRPSLSTR